MQQILRRCRDKGKLALFPLSPPNACTVFHLFSSHSFPLPALALGCYFMPLMPQKRTQLNWIWSFIMFGLLVGFVWMAFKSVWVTIDSFYVWVLHNLFYLCVCLSDRVEARALVSYFIILCCEILSTVFFNHFNKVLVNGLFMMLLKSIFSFWSKSS